MGIPFLFSWLKNNYPQVIHSFQSTNINYLNSKNINIDNFGIDMNGLFHNIAQYVYKYGNHKLPSNFGKIKVSKEKNEEIYRRICERIVYLISVIKPKKRLFICIDGIAGLSKCCLTGDTLVTMSSGISKRIDQIKKGEYVLGWNGKGFTSTMNLGLQEKGKKNTIKITMYDSKKLTCTPDHKILIIRNNEKIWTAAGDIVKDDKIVSGLSAPYDVRDEMEENWELTDEFGVLFNMKTENDRENTLIIMRMLGYILSDGYITNTEKTKRIGVCLGTKMDAEKFVNDIITISGRKMSIYKCNGDKRCVYTVSLTQILVKLILRIPNIQTGKRVIQPIKLPKFLIQNDCPKSIIREFLGGLFGGDGHSPILIKSNDNYSLASIKFSQSIVKKYEESLISYMKDIQILLKRIGITNTTIRGPVDHTYTNNRMIPKDVKTNPRIRYFINLPMNSYFGKYIGFRYAINKSLRLDIASAYWNLCEHIKNEKQKIVNKTLEIYDNYVPEYICSYCNYKFRSRNSLTRHITSQCKKSDEKKQIPITHITIKMALHQSREEYLEKNILLHKNILSNVREVNCIKNRGFPKSIRRPRNSIDAHEFLQKTNTLKWFQNNIDNKYSYAMEQEDTEIPFYILPVLDICDNGEQQVYDIEVEQNNSFLSNGLCVHNCQQRQRRFKSAKERGKEEEKFDSNSMSPGTEFMNKMSEYIKKYIKNELYENIENKKLEIIYSDSKVPGEGEHKIINHIKRIIKKDNNCKKESYCIHGADADLVMLSLSTHLQQFYIIRENHRNYNEFIFLDIGLFYKELVELLKGESKCNKNLIIEDFIFLCYLVGNDFLPHIPSLEILDGGIEFLLSTYTHVLNNYGNLITNNISNKTINITSFIEYLKIIEKRENELMIKSYRSNKRYPDPILEKCIQFNKFNLEKYKKLYYDIKLNGEHINKISYEYINGINWVLNYYFIGMKNWLWYYPYHYAPFASELIKYLENNKVEYKSIKNKPLKSYEQLLCILPPQSKNLVPEKLQEIYDLEEFKEYFPDKIDIDYDGKRNEWEGIVKVPFIDVKKIIEKVKEYNIKEDKNNTYIYNYK